MSIGVVSHVVQETGLTRSAVYRLARSAGKRYKVFKIPKKKPGMYRTVAQPAREIKAMQRAIVKLLSKSFSPHSAATAYEKGRKLIQNAEPHRFARYLLKFDFQDFFPSIGDLPLRSVIPNRFPEIAETELEFVLNCCLWIPPDSTVRGLCIGAPSSPFLSNLALYEFDQKVFEWCRENEVTYSRYSDDISFSAARPNVLSEVERFLRDTVTSTPFNFLSINESKRVSVSRATALRITGLTLSNAGTVTVGRKRKRGVRSGVNHWVSGRLGDTQARRLRGEIAFVLSVEPDFRDTLIRVFGPGILPILPRSR